MNSAVYPVRAELPGDEVAASIVLRPGTNVRHEEIIAYCANDMSYFMVPRFIDIAL